MTRAVNLAEMSVTAGPGTASFVLTAATSGNRTYAAAGVGDGETVRYKAKEGATWEIGDGTWTAATGTLTRSVRSSSNANALVNFGTGVTVAIVPDADLFRDIDALRWFLD